MSRAARDLTSKHGPLVALDNAVAEGILEPNASQRLAAEHLQSIFQRLKGEGTLATQKSASAKSGLTSWLFRRDEGEHTSAVSGSNQGVYFVGGVGVGKTMLMDMFALSLDEKQVWREHFHKFMYKVQDDILLARKEALSKSHDPLMAVAEKIAKTYRVICLDEFFVNNIADAMILQRFFSALFERGVILVTTSNVQPDDLYKDGLQRDRFLPFIQVLKQNVKVVQLASERDYRQTVLHVDSLYLTPLGRGTEALLHDTFRSLNDGEEGEPTSLFVRGRDVDVPLAGNKIAFFRFDDLCGRPLGPEDYNVIADRFTVVFVADIPELSDDRLTEAKRFISLIDVLYDSGTLMVVSAAQEADQIYTGIQAPEFERTMSRLNEMQSQEYLSRVAPKLRLTN